MFAAGHILALAGEFDQSPAGFNIHCYNTCRDSGINFMDGSVGTDAEMDHLPEILHIMNKISELIEESFPNASVVASLGIHTHTTDYQGY